MKRTLLIFASLIIAGNSYADSDSKKRIGFGVIGEKTSKTCAKTVSPITKASTDNGEVVLTPSEVSRICFDGKTNIIESLISRKNTIVSKINGDVFVSISVAPDESACVDNLKRNREEIGMYITLRQRTYKDYKLKFVREDGVDGEPKYQEGDTICTELIF